MSDGELEYTHKRKTELQSLIARSFKRELTINSLLFEDVPIVGEATATIFSTTDHTIYALCLGKKPLRLIDVQQSIKAMGFIPAAYVAPFGDRSYFARVGYEIFQHAYPARSGWTPSEESYYQTLVPYSPALVRIQAVKGPIRRYNAIDGSWQTIFETPARLVKQ